jgi:hypothetical protein
MDGIRQVDRKAGSLHEVQCEAEVESWLIATRDVPESGALEALGVPVLAAKVVEASQDDDRCNWYAFPLEANTDNIVSGQGTYWPCEKLPLQASSLMAVRSKRVGVVLSRDSDGGVHMLRLVSIE